LRKLLRKVKAAETDRFGTKMHQNAPNRVLNFENFRRNIPGLPTNGDSDLKPRERGERERPG